MGREQTLLRRIADNSGSAASDRYGATMAEDVDELSESVRHHLTRLLNARHGMSEAVPDYGLPSLVDITIGMGEQHVPVLQKAIRATIEKYEPRLRHVRVSCISQEDAPTRQSLAFAVEAILFGRSGEHSVRYLAALAKDGRFTIAD